MRENIGVLLLFLVALALSGCRVLTPWRWDELEKCDRAMKIFREEPTRPYRVIKMIVAEDEEAIVSEACDAGVDAVIANGTVFTRGGILAKEEVRGAAIRFVTDAAP